jgi:hypothetical protein
MSKLKVASRIGKRYSSESPSWKTICKSAAKKLPVEKRQEFLDYAKSGMTLGDARDLAKITKDEMHGIIMMQLRSLNYMEFEVTK